MAVTLNYDADLKILIVKVKGYLSLDDYKDTAHQLLNSNEYPPDVDAVWDLNEMHFDNIDLKFEEELVSLRQQHSEQRGHARIAIVSSNTLAEPMIKLFKVISTHLHQKIDHFPSMEAAQAWLTEAQKS